MKPKRSDRRDERSRTTDDHTRGRGVVLTPGAGRRLSPTERVYPDPIVAKTTFEQERQYNPLHRRAPTPYTSRSRRNSQSSLSSVVQPARPESRQSFRSEGSVSRSQADVWQNDQWEPVFGATNGIGPAGEAFEYIGLGRKEPRHRKYQNDMLRSAMRGGPAPSVQKPLPRRPRSIFGSSALPIFEHSRRKRPNQRRSMSQSTLRSLFSALSISTQPEMENIEPAEDLHSYLATAEVPAWRHWSRGAWTFASGRRFQSRDSAQWRLDFDFAQHVIDCKSSQ